MKNKIEEIIEKIIHYPIMARWDSVKTAEMEIEKATDKLTTLIQEEKKKAVEGFVEFMKTTEAYKVDLHGWQDYYEMLAKEYLNE